MIKRSPMVQLALLSGLLAWTGHAAPFRNLDFEEADLSRVNRAGQLPWIHDYGSGKLEDLLPGWRAFWPDRSVLGSGYNWPGQLVSMGQPAVNLVQRGVVDDIFQGWNQRFSISGEYALLIQSHNYSGSPIVTLQQEGDIPVGAEYLEYEAVFPVDHVLVNGVEIPGRPADAGRYRHDIRQFAGTTASLEFVFGPGAFLTGVQNGIDNIRFSPIPEPGTLVLLGIGGVWLWWRNSRRGQGGGIHGH